MPKFVLILMVKNEEKILRRCLEAVEGFVDGFAINDTGSTDKTVDIAHEFLKTRKGCVGLSTWKNFGHNRTLSFQIARDFCVASKMDLADTYGLLLDADMSFVPGSLRQQTLGKLGYTIIQSAGGLDYPNARLIRMDHDWVCKGVTHEYWDGACEHLAKSICHIDDHNDGGCKADKFTRDLELLEKGLEEEPTNVRYIFYLAQTHHSLGNWEKAIEMYKQRIAAGGWYEEVWYSHYMIARSYESLNQPYLFEEWVQRGYEFHPKRSEAIYQLAKYFRVKGDHYKAYHYVMMGSAIPMPADSLFIETDIYNGLFDYEKSILDYYVKSDRTEGMMSSVRYMLKLGHFQPNVLSNLKFYVKPVRATRTRFTLPSPFGPEYTASAISLIAYPIANVRFVNYKVVDGEFVTPNGESLTENASFNLATGELIARMDERTVDLPQFDNHIRGLEDVRVYTNARGHLGFTATVHTYESRCVNILRGDYSPGGSYSNCVSIRSPTGRTCEKNWLPITDTDTMIYGWHPLTIVDSEGAILKTQPTPPMFSMFRGSAPPIRVNGSWWALVHFVDYEHRRKYYHAVIELNAYMTPIRMTLPFVFVSPDIEYCLSMRYADSTLYCYAGINETDPSEFAIPVIEFTWISL